MISILTDPPSVTRGPPTPRRPIAEADAEHRVLTTAAGRDLLAEVAHARRPSAGDVRGGGRPARPTRSPRRSAWSRPAVGRGQVREGRGDVARPGRPRAGDGRGGGPPQGRAVRRVGRLRPLLGHRRRRRGDRRGRPRGGRLRPRRGHGPSRPLERRGLRASATGSRRSSAAPRPWRSRPRPSSTSTPTAGSRPTAAPARSTTMHPALSSPRARLTLPRSAIKLGPASDFARALGDLPVEIELTSHAGECKEATVWFGDLTTPGVRRARLAFVRWRDLDRPRRPVVPRRPGRRPPRPVGLRPGPHAGPRRAARRVRPRPWPGPDRRQRLPHRPLPRLLAVPRPVRGRRDAAPRPQAPPPHCRRPPARPARDQDEGVGSAARRRAEVLAAGRAEPRDTLTRRGAGRRWRSWRGGGDARPSSPRGECNRGHPDVDGPGLLTSSDPPPPPPCGTGPSSARTSPA